MILFIIAAPLIVSRYKHILYLRTRTSRSRRIPQNDGMRTVDFKLWNMKVINIINCHERRIDFETELCRRGLDLISKGIWKFTGTVNHIYSMEEFDKANYDMEAHTDNFIKGAVRCDL